MTDNPLRDRFGEAWPPILGTPLNVTTHEQPWTDITDPSTVKHGALKRVAFLRHGTTEGRASVALLVELDDGQIVVAETTYRLFANAARFLAASPAAAEET